MLVFLLYIGEKYLLNPVVFFATRNVAEDFERR